MQILGILMPNAIDFMGLIMSKVVFHHIQTVLGYAGTYLYQAATVQAIAVWLISLD